MHQVVVFLFTLLLELVRRNFSHSSKLSLEEDPSSSFNVPIKGASHCHHAVFSSSKVCMVFIQDFRHLVNVWLAMLVSFADSTSTNCVCACVFPYLVFRLILGSVSISFCIFAESQLTLLHPFKSSQKSFANAHWSATALLLYLKIAFLNSCS